MRSKLLNVSLLGILAALPLIAGGCASTDKGEYGLTGTDHSTVTNDGARYTDSKGHYRSEWIGQTGR